MKNGFKWDSLEKMWKIDKSAGSNVDYSHEWAQWLALSDNDAIATSTWAIDKTSMTIESSIFTPTLTTVFVSGGVVGKTYRVTNTITTTGGRTETRTFLVRVVASLSG